MKVSELIRMLAPYSSQEVEVLLYIGNDCFSLPIQEVEEETGQVYINTNAMYLDIGVCK